MKFVISYISAVSVGCVLGWFMATHVKPALSKLFHRLSDWADSK
jgi:hypothetical protein